MKRFPVARSIPRTIGTLGLGIAVLTGCKPSTQPQTTAPEQPAAPTPEPSEARAEKQYPEPPAPAPLQPVDFPDVDKFTLPNGLTVYVVENHEVPLVTAHLVVRTGEIDDQVVAPMTAQMLAEGTKTRSKANIDQAIEFVGASLSAAAGTHVSHVHSKVLEKDLNLALTLMADQVMNPLFPADALEKIKAQAKTALQGQKASPQVLANRLFAMVAYPEGHPYGLPLPSDADIDAVTKESLEKFHQTFYRANNAFLILAGDITEARAEPLVERAFGRWQPANPQQMPANPLNKFDRFDAPEELVVHLVDRPGSAQAEVIVGNVTLSRNHDDWEKLLIASEILGGLPAGRLFKDVREERGLTYNIEAHLSEGQAPGTFRIQSRTRTKSTAELLRAIFDHLEKMRAEPPRQDELDRIVAHEVGSFPLRIETADQVATNVRDQLTYYLPENYWDTYREEVAAVSPDDVQAVSRRFMFAVPHVVVVGSAKKLERELKKALRDAKIVKYNTDLERQ